MISKKLFINGKYLRRPVNCNWFFRLSSKNVILLEFPNYLSSINFLGQVKFKGYKCTLFFKLWLFVTRLLCATISFTGLQEDINMKSNGALSWNSTCLEDPWNSFEQKMDLIRHSYFIHCKNQTSRITKKCQIHSLISMRTFVWNQYSKFNMHEKTLRFGAAIYE